MYFLSQPRPQPTAQNWFFILWNLGTRHLFSYLCFVLGLHPEKSWIYTIKKAEEATWKNLRCHLQNNFSGCRLKGWLSEVCVFESTPADTCHDISWRFSNHISIPKEKQVGHMQVSRSYIPFLIASYFFKIVFIFDFGWQPNPLSISTWFLKYRVSLDFFSISKYRV